LGASSRSSAVAALAASSLLSISGAWGAEPPIRLTFDWGKELRVSVDAVKTKRAGPQSQTMAAKSVAHLQRTSDGYDATFDELKFTIDGADAADQQPIAVLNGLAFFGRLTPQGEFVELHEFPDLQRKVRQLYREHFAGRGTPADIDRAIALGTSRELLQFEANRTWIALLGWHGAEATPGSMQVTIAQGVMPVVNRPIEMRAEWSIVGREKCSKAEAVPKCVRIKSTTQPDPAKLQQTFDAWAKEVGIAALAEQLRDMKIRDSIEILTEPDTLKPHLASWSRELTATLPDGKTGPMTQTDTTTMRFEYLK
jgi:hypothetical protein